MIEPIHKVTSILKASGALSFWDYASAGPGIPIDMNPVLSGTDAALDPTLVAKDAIFLAPHKFAGGVGDPQIEPSHKTLPLVLTWDLPPP